MIWSTRLMSPSTFWNQAIFSRSSASSSSILCALEAREAAQAHLEDRVGLDLREPEALDEARLGLRVGVATRG